MSKFKVGDEVKFNPQNASSDNGRYIRYNSDYYFVRDVGVIKQLNPSYYDYRVVWGDRDVCLNECELELITNNKTMNIKEKFITAFLPEPEKSFRKAGITNGDGILTTEGQEIFLTYLLKKEGVIFKTEVVDVLLAEEAKTCK